MEELTGLDLSGSTWTDDRVEALTRLWDKGVSASQIAAAIGGVTRNAVIGKAQRLQARGVIRARDNPIAAARIVERVKERAKVVPKPVARPTVTLAPVSAARAPVPMPEPPRCDRVDDAPAAKGAVALADLRRHHCRFPLWGDDRRTGLFCGKRARPGSAWCDEHRAVVYTPRLGAA